jgi:serine/threonine-protein kinase RsbT
VDGTARARLQEQLRRMTSTGGVPTAQTVAIRTEADAAHVRLVARTFCEDLGGSSFHAQKVATSVSELARNQLMYAGGGSLTLSAERTPRTKVKVLAQDSGKGIPAAQLQLILSGGYRSKTGMGMGLLGVKRLSDSFDVQSGPTGTRVQFEVVL